MLRHQIRIQVEGFVKAQLLRIVSSPLMGYTVSLPYRKSVRLLRRSERVDG